MCIISLVLLELVKLVVAIQICWTSLQAWIMSRLRKKYAVHTNAMVSHDHDRGATANMPTRYPTAVFVL